MSTSGWSHRGGCDLTPQTLLLSPGLIDLTSPVWQARGAGVRELFEVAPIDADGVDVPLSRVFIRADEDDLRPVRRPRWVQARRRCRVRRCSAAFGLNRELVQSVAVSTDDPEALAIGSARAGVEQNLVPFRAAIRPERIRSRGSGRASASPEDRCVEVGHEKATISSGGGHGPGPGPAAAGHVPTEESADDKAKATQSGEVNPQNGAVPRRAAHEPRKISTRRPARRRGRCPLVGCRGRPTPTRPTR